MSSFRLRLFTGIFGAPGRSGFRPFPAALFP
jgi:hypothetical protein